MSQRNIYTNLVLRSILQWCFSHNTLLRKSFETSHSQCRLFFIRLVIFVHSYGLQLPDTRGDACSEHASPRVSGSYIPPFLLYYTTAYAPTITCFCQDPLLDIRHVPFLAPRNSVCRGDEGGQELRDLRWRGCIRRSVYRRETIDNFVMHILRHVTLCNTWCNCEISLRTKLLLQQIVTHCSLFMLITLPTSLTALGHICLHFVQKTVIRLALPGLSLLFH